MPSRRLRVGVIGCGDVAQVVHLPTLQLLTHLYDTVAVCDVSAKTAAHCASVFHIPIATTDLQVLLDSPSIDVIVVLTSDEYHAPYAVAALHAGKHVMVEKPLTLSLASGREIIAAEDAAPNGARVFVGYMRRYAASLETFQREISTIPRIHYARVRDIIGPNAYFISQSGASPMKFFDDIPSSASADRNRRLQNLLEEAWGLRFDQLSEKKKDYCCLLANLGSHGLSLMRECLGGLPDAVAASRVSGKWYTTMFDYRNRKGEGQPFTCLYETGIDSVPRFDSHVAVYGEKKSVTIRYDTPFIKGLGITVEVDEMNEHGEKVHYSVQSGYEDAYTRELKELYACIVEKKDFKTTATDALEDLKLFKMMLEKYPAENES
ncbi:hypothetical protein LTR10_013127 [Elasticomyces elasticus]|uniref:Gfo/Idh/MocA-like oxidoreductase N-terminal domain-containing protein n=1 Tax=Exophiala sideris TaxID=1016849 RepID=A0ABR0JAV2_9EURO|nr:hypothetical protein LTR10_013127 [Elasticomyces elasticus]KAK5030502.1 hypothetical protein LTS07_005286 [Exophiala sideris]KAK5038556.1 hypothetical protein LTR13_004303 [Exophiala sideris]KAK5060437.1 hypothetical protein LTR69_005754 [Exophiala sideris]KAK5183349.1 hypothetical protein LTR44_004350 [Eurotiomycetes sp. CCFEE 6388]